MAAEPRWLDLRIFTDARREEEKKDEKEVEYLVGSGNPHGAADIHDWSRDGAGIAVGRGRAEPTSGAAD